MFGRKAVQPAPIDDTTLVTLRAIADALVELNATMIRMEIKIDVVASVYQTLQK